VIGEHRYTYDLWGDTVNMASRMESHGIAGQVQVSEATRALIQTPLPWVERTLDVKGKGEMTAYVLDPDAVPDAVKSRPLEVAALAERFERPSASVPVIGRSDSVGAIL
jgi:class 3 adenylate cyclase